MRTLIALLLALALLPAARAADYAYFDFEPDIITNFISSGPKLGYVRLSISIQTASAADQALVQQHEPLLRSALVRFFGDQHESRIKSVKGREELRLECLELVNSLLEREAKKKAATNLLFTKYLFE